MNETNEKARRLGAVYTLYSNFISEGITVKNSMMKKRIASVAAAAVMSVSAVAGTFGKTDIISSDGSVTAFAAESIVKFISTVGYGEAMYATWSPISGATGYNVYVDGTQIDSMLIRQYSGYMRADAVGLKAGSHTMKVVPVIGGKEDSSKAAETKANSYAHDRTGFGWVNGTSSGAYNEDGTLKSNAVVIYVTDSNKDSVKASIDSTGKGASELTGVQNIILGYKKGKESRPLCVRFIGNISDPANMPSGDLMVDTVTAGLTIEGIGNDTVFNGFGLVMKNSSNVEVRNIGFMNCNSKEGDDCGLQQKNDHVWVHNCDFFYGDAGSDADQVKGDGALDTKTSTFITHSYNHFWDNGKCNLQGMKSESTENYITYHHNWYDHSDSRHPRIRTCSVHIYNNYFDGNAKYGVGVTMGASAFVENNYFRNCKYPMLISQQGSDDITGGTFSGEAGGVIKSCGNYITGAKAYTTYKDNSTDFDAYEVSNSKETVPSNVKSKQGGTAYNNFDTSSIMYSYTPDSPEDAKNKIMEQAGRVDGGDLKWTFDNAVDDESYAVNDALKAALVSYKPSVVAIGSGFKENTGSNDPIVTTITTTTTAKPVVTTTTTTAKDPITNPVEPVTGDGVIYASPKGGGDGKTIGSPTDLLSAIKSVKAGGTIYLLDGTYGYTSTILIDESNSGEAGKYKTISAYPGADVKIDFTGQAVAGANRGFVLDGSYWHFYGFEIANAGDNGMLLSGDNNIIEMMVFNGNQDTGLQLSRYQTSYNTIAQWPSNNLIKNCTSKNNCDDATMENADGFAAKLTCGEGNVFDGCMSYCNSDDGWDLYAKAETGPIGVVTIKNSIAFRNGFTESGKGYGDADGNGFKLGGGGIGTRHIVENCLAFENLNCGFTDNNNPEFGEMKNCTAYNNGIGGNGKANYMVYRCSSSALFDGLISYTNTSRVSKTNAPGIKLSNDKFVGKMSNSMYYNSKYYKIDSQTAMTNGAKTGSVVTPSDSDFITLDVPAMGTDFHKIWRNADGSPNPGGFAEQPLKSGVYDMGYHMSNGTVKPPVTTTTTSGNSDKTTTTTTVKIPPTPVAGGYTHDFTANGTASDFYTITGNLSTGKGTVNYAGKTLTQCLKMESASNIAFKAANAGTITLVFVEPAATIKVDGTKYTASGDGIITVDLAAGDHLVTKADTANLFYMVYTEKQSGPDPSEGIAGDANCDGEVRLNDAILILQAIGNPAVYGINGTDKSHITAQGISNGDVSSKGDGLTSSDALAVQKYTLYIISALPES